MAEFIQQHQAPLLIEIQLWWMFGRLHFSSIFSLSRLLKDYLKECRKCKLLLFSFSGLWEAMCENSRKMSRYVASPDEQKEKTQQEMTTKTTARDPKLFEESKHLSKWKLGRKQQRSLLNEGPRHHEASPLSTFQILSLYFSCCHGDRWAHHRYYHNKSNSSLLCPWELPGSEN